MRFAFSFTRFSALLFLVLFPLTAMAQVAAPVTESASSLFLQTMLVPLLGALGTVITAALAFLAVYLKNKAAVESTNATAKIAEVLGAKAASIMAAIVAGLWAGMREPLIAASADGTLSAEDKKKLQEAAVAQFLASLGDAFKSQLLGGLGVSESGLATVAVGLAEKAVGELKVTAARESAVRAQAESIVAQANQTAAAAAPKPADKPEDVVARLAGETPKP